MKEDLNMLVLSIGSGYFFEWYLSVMRRISSATLSGMPNSIVVVAIKPGSVHSIKVSYQPFVIDA